MTVVTLSLVRQSSMSVLDALLDPELEGGFRSLHLRPRSTELRGGQVEGGPKSWLN